MRSSSRSGPREFGINRSRSSRRPPAFSRSTASCSTSSIRRAQARPCRRRSPAAPTPPSGSARWESWGSYAKAAPIRIIGATMTGANDTYLYVPADSPIKSLKDADGRTVAFSTVGSSTHMVVLALEQQAGVKFKAVAAGSATATLTQVMSSQIDVGWAAAPFGVEAVEQGKIRVIARASDVVAYRTQTSRVLAANLTALDRRGDVFVRYMRAYRDGLDWLYSDPAALTAYAAWAGSSERIARRLRDEFLPKADIDPSNISGLPELMAQAVTFRFMSAPLTGALLGELIQLSQDV